jgi:WD40 repeat protein/DNA-binding SARP family transcriptional activator
MDFRLLGPIEVLDGETALPLGGPKPRTLLAHLVLDLNHRVPADRLIDSVWGEHPPEAVRNSLQTYVSHLRKVLGPDRLEGRAAGYVLHGRPDEVDAVRFERLVDSARRAGAVDPAAAVHTYREALALWRGPALDDLADQPSLRVEIARLEELRLAAIEERVEVELTLGCHAEQVPELERLTARHPLRERLWAQLLVALYRSGRQADALAAFEDARRLLADELGVDPSPELRRVHEQVLRQDVALEVPGVPLHGYRLLEPLGQGSFGVVHRAYQPRMGREVAIKAIHPHLANDAEFIRRFEAEAQLVARLEHPYLVPLYDYWREPAGAYLVMRYLRGGSLRERLAHGPLTPETVVGVVEQVASALAVAHDLGVVHRDVKPANILLDEDGNAYLSDFGIAKDLADTDGAGRSPPSSIVAYLSPEEVSGEPPTPQADLYSLGLVVYEMLAGSHPYADTPPEQLADRHQRTPVPSLLPGAAGVPAAADEVIQRATAKAPQDRYADAPTLAAALREAVAGAPTTTAVSSSPSRNPYKGLRAFQEADADDFFGRDDLVGRLLARLAEDGEAARFLAVVGPSGSGKSSLVRAGLVPALRAGTIPGSQDWFVVDMVPGRDPFTEFRTALRRVAARPLPANLSDLLAQDPSALVRAAGWVLADDHADLLLVVDQFEEVFTLVDDEPARAAFLDSLVTAATDPNSRIRILVTLRADFYDHPLRYRSLAELVREHTEVVLPLAAAELERATVGPAAQVGVTIEPAVVAQVVADVVDQPGSLPLLQYALTELFDRRENATLTADDYRQLGGVSGALARRAEEELAGLDTDGQQAAHQLLLRLVTLGEGVEDTRRRVSRAELQSLLPDPDRMAAVIEAFGRARLLSFDHNPDTREPTVEVAHEALLREWGRLRGWIEAAREDLRTERRLAAATQDWADADRGPSFLAAGPRLEQFEALEARGAIALTPEERAFVAASLAERDRVAAVEAARREREQALERRSLWRLRALAAVLTVAALLAGSLSVVALRQTGRLAEQVRITTARELAAAAVANLDVDPELATLLALEAVEATRSIDGSVLLEAEGALHRAVKSSRLIRTVPHGGLDLAVNADGTRFVTSGADPTDNRAIVWDTETGAEVVALAVPEGGRPAVAFGPDVNLLATTHNDATVRLWDATTGEELRVFDGHEGPIAYPAFSPDGRWLATAGWEDPTAWIWDLATGTVAMTLVGHDGNVMDVAFSPDSTRLASTSTDQTARLWDVATGDLLATLTGHEQPVNRVAFSPDGARVATSSNDATVRIWDAESGAHLQTLFADAGPWQLAYSPDGRRIAAGTTDATARVWDAEDGRLLLTLAGHATDVASVAFTPDGDHLLTSSLDNTTRLWDISAAGSRDWLTVPGPTGRRAAAAFHPDGTSFAVPGADMGVTIHDATTGDVLATLSGHDAPILQPTFSPDGSRLAAASPLGNPPAGTVPVWDIDSGQLLFELTGHGAEVRDVAYSPDGSRLATASMDGTVRLWDATSGTEQRVIEGWDEAWSVAFSPDGRFVAASGARFPPEVSYEVDQLVFDAHTGERIATLAGHEDWTPGLAFAPDGRLVTSGWDGTARIWDLTTGEADWTLRQGTPVAQVAVSPDGARIATAGEDGTARLWDLATGRQVLTLHGHDAAVFGVAFSPDGRLLATSSPDGTVALHLLPIDEFVALARTRLTRSLTDDECRQYLHVEQCPQD